MIPKTANSYIIPAHIQSEIDALVRDLDLVLVRKSFAPLPDSRFVREYFPLPKLVETQKNKPLSAADFSKRNHTYVHKADYYKEIRPTLWD